MELVESYIKEVAQFLPENIRYDVAQDLRSNIADEVYARADEADRAPCREDQVAVLRNFGHPLKVAAQFQPARYVIGPDLYPIFMQTLKVVLGFGIALQVVFFLLSGLTGFGEGAFGPGALIAKGLGMLFWLFAIVVSVFVILEITDERLDFYSGWQPERLSTNTIGVINRRDVLTNLLSEGFFLLWWNDILVFTDWLPLLGGVLHLSSAWDIYYWPLNILFGAAFLLHLWVLTRGVWHHAPLIGEIVLNVALLAVGGVLLTADSLVNVVNTSASSDIAPQILEHIQTTVRLVLAVIMGFVGWDIWLAFKLLRSKLGVRHQASD